MLGNFSYCNPTRLHFGENALDHLKEELAKYGDKVLLVYGEAPLNAAASMIRWRKFWTPPARNGTKSPG